VSLQVAHALPGRLRVQGRDLRFAEDFLADLGESLAEVEGIHHVQTTPRTGSLLVLYDPERIREEDLRRKIEELSEMRVVDPLDAGPGKSRVSRLTQAPFRQINENIFRWTEGTLDLRSMVPIGLALYGTIKLLRFGPLPSIPWYTLYWWSFRTFVIFNRPVSGGIKNNDIG
jgi:hypothetical protein